MTDRDRLNRLLDERKPGHTLPQPFYIDSDIFDFDLQAIFNRNWIMAGFASELERPGSYLALNVGRTPILVVKNSAGAIVGFHNSCRHRGAQICKTGSGRMPRLVCPYHQWSYNLDGRLLSARGMDESFDMAAHSLLPIRVEVVAGCIYVTLSDQAPDFAPFAKALAPALEVYNLQNVKLAQVREYDEQANWKLVMENGRECHHCGARHPEFISAFPPEIVDGGSPFPQGEESSPFMRRMQELGLETRGYLEDWWQIGRVRMKDGFTSFSMDGRPLVNKRLTEVNGGNLGSLRWAIEPNNFCHVTSDSVFTFNANPTSPLTTRVTAKWYVHKDAVEGKDYEIDRLTHMWHRTNLQDQELAENNQCGVNGIGYRPGPYSAGSEPYIIRFVDWYCGQLRSALAKQHRS